MAKKKTEQTTSGDYIWIEMNMPPSGLITSEQERSIVAQAAKKYNVQPARVRFSTKLQGVYGQDGEEEAINADTINNIQDPKYQVQLFKKYIEEHGISGSDYNWDQILEIDSRVNAVIDYEAYEKGRRFELNYAKWENFLSYGSGNFFDFRKLHGLVLLRGEPANKSGKSTFAYDLIHFALFGKTKSGKADTKAEIFNNYRPDEKVVYVELGLAINGENYVIKRTLTKKGKYNIEHDLKYYRVNERGENELLQDVDNMADVSSVKTTKAIKEAIGTEEDFDRIISANAKDLDELISMKDTERGRIFSRWIGLKPIEDKEIKAKEMWSNELVGRTCDMYDRETLKNEIEGLNATNVEYGKIIKKNIGEIENTKKKMDAADKEKDELLTSKKNIDANLLKVDVATVEKKMADITTNGKNKKAEITRLTDEVSKYGDVEYSKEDYSALTDEKSKLDTEIGSLKANIQSTRKLIEELKKGEYCPTCKRKYDDDEHDHSEVIQENQEKVNKWIARGIECRTRCDEVEKLIAAISVKRDKAIEKNQKELKIQALTVEVNKLRTSYVDLLNTKNAYSQNKDAISENNEIDNKVNVLKSTIVEYGNIIRRLESENVAYQKDIEANENTVKEKEVFIKKIEAEIEREKSWKLYLTMIGKDGICKLVLKDTLPKINNELERLLCDVADFKVEVEVNSKNDIEFWLIRDDIRTKLSAGSGLERTMASLALRVVLARMSMLSRPPFIVLDEILGSVAKENYEDMKKLYDKIALQYTYILHICHIDLDWYNCTITTRKVDNISTISIDE